MQFADHLDDFHFAPGNQRLRANHHPFPIASNKIATDGTVEFRVYKDETLGVQKLATEYGPVITTGSVT